MRRFHDHDSEKKRLLIPATTDEESVRSGYDTFVEKSDYQVTDTSLLLAGPRSIYGANGHLGRPTQPRMNGKSRHHRALSFAETVDPITLSWHNINVYAPIKGSGVCTRAYDTGEVKQILHDVSGITRPGSLLALMGASGAGKSTLLNVLTYRNRGDLVVEGSVKVNGQPVERGIKAISAYIQQDDVFVETLKVREHLWFQAQLRMDSHIPMADRAQRVEEVMTEMGLMKCADTCIGAKGSVKGISGGEMKRLSFASEVLTNPPLMFCDEPTSGLDSFMAENVIKTLKSMSQKGKTILCTIHQPSSEVYVLFDQLLLLAEGRTSYLGQPNRALEFFKFCGQPCPVNYNPADHFVHCLAIQPGQEVECAEKSCQFAEKYKDTADYRQLTLGLREMDAIQDTDLIARTTAIQRQSPYKASWWRQLRAIVWRSWLSQARDANVFAVRVIQTILVAVIVGVIFFQHLVDDSKSVMNLNGAIFLMVTNMSFQNIFTVLNAFSKELSIFFREHHNGMYRVDTYFIAKNIADLFVFILLPTLFAIIIYWTIGMQVGVTQFFLVWLTIVVVAMCAVSLGYMISTVCGRLDFSMALYNPIMMPLMLFGGFMLNLNTLSPWVSWLQWISWFRYSYEILLAVQWTGVANLTCASPSATATTGIFFTQNGSSGGGIPGSGNGEPCFESGEDVLRYYSFKSGSQMYIFNFTMILVHTVAFRFLSFLALWVRSREKHH